MNTNQTNETIINKEMDLVTLNDIIGQEEAIEEIRNLLAMKSDPSIAKYWKVRSPKGILFVGPPGTGKTMTVRALVNESCEFQLAEIKYQDIASKWLDQPIENLRNVFAQIEQAAKEMHVIVFIDEIDSLLPERSNETLHHAYVNIVNSFIQWMDGGLYSLENVTIIGATNNFNRLDKAAIRPGRFDKLIEFKELDAEGITEVIKLNLDKRKYDEVQLDRIDWVAVKNAIALSHLTGAEVANIIDIIAKKKMNEHYRNINSSKRYSTSVPTGIKLQDSDLMPSPISTEDIISEINLLFEQK